jgi:hypothetical protein
MASSHQAPAGFDKSVLALCKPKRHRIKEFCGWSPGSPAWIADAHRRARTTRVFPQARALGRKQRGGMGTGGENVLIGYRWAKGKRLIGSTKGRRERFDRTVRDVSGDLQAPPM